MRSSLEDVNPSCYGTPMQDQYQALFAAVDAYCAKLAALPPAALDSVVRSTAVVSILLENIYQQQTADPIPALLACIERQFPALADAQELAKHTVRPGSEEGGGTTTERLYEVAWGGYSDATYDHAVSLVEDRLRRSGLDEAFFSGKRCFDGGCGIGRLSVAIARMGAAEVIAADIGQQSLDYAQRQARRLGLSTIRTARLDVTDLSRFPDGAFDFVASYGVLHHTPDCLTGVREHFRVTRRGGLFWLYLLGDGGLYWEVYDRLRAVIRTFPIEELKAALMRLRLREGFVYNYLDCMLAPRTYHLESDIIALLKHADPGLSWQRAKGGSVIDDTDRVLAARFGPQITGPQGEVRILVTRS